MHCSVCIKMFTKNSFINITSKLLYWTISVWSYHGKICGPYDLLSFNCVTSFKHFVPPAKASGLCWRYKKGMSFNFWTSGQLKMDQVISFCDYIADICVPHAGWKLVRAHWRLLFAVIFCSPSSPMKIMVTFDGKRKSLRSKNSPVSG